MNLSSQSFDLLERLFPLLYVSCFLLLLWQAFQVMGRGFQAIPRPGDSSIQTTPMGDRPADRTGKLTIHPELLDAQGRITSEDLLTVRFSGDNGEPATPVDPS